MGVHRALASDHLQNGGVVQPSMDFWRALEIDFLKNTIGVELGENVIPKKPSKLPSCVPCENMTVKHHGGMWYPSFKTGKKVKNRNIKSKIFRTIPDEIKIPPSLISVPMIYYFALDDFQIIKMRG